MLRSIYNSMSLAIANIRSSFLHTFLSVLGIVIGVASLVGILSLIDGMEKYAHEQISKTTTLEAVFIESNTYTQVDGIRMRKDSLKVIDYEAFKELRVAVQLSGLKHYLQSNYPGRFKVSNSDSVRGGLMSFVNQEKRSDVELKAGRWFSDEDLYNSSQVAVISTKLAFDLTGDSTKNTIGSNLMFKSKKYRVIGMVSTDHPTGRAFVPFTLLSLGELKGSTPTTVLLASTVQDVPEIKEQVAEWLSSKYGKNQEDFKVITNESRVEQANQGFLIFRVVMGLIVGISVLVGGIGVMNVLTISVTERTREIGVRKAVGAKRKDILLQFLSESVTISTFGSFIGLLAGVLGTLIIVPVIKAITKAPFEAAFTLNTLLIISIVAVLVGMIFGTYPAMKASRLDPVEAIRHE